MALVPTALSSLMTPSILAKIQLAFPEVAAYPEQLSQQQKLAQAISEGIAEIIIPYLIANTQVTVTVAPGIPVATVGSPVAQTGATTAPGAGIGQIS